jgi:hypothetical protein
MNQTENMHSAAKDELSFRYPSRSMGICFKRSATDKQSGVYLLQDSLAILCLLQI